MPHLAAWELLDAATATRKLLLQAGYRPLPAIGKAIAVPGWTDIAATEGIIDNWSRFLVRFGNAPKRAISLRTDQPLKK